MPTPSNKELIEKAKSVINSRLIKNDCTIGDVGCALVSAKGKLFLGVSLDACSGIGFCAEHSAVAAMVTSGEEEIDKIVAVAGDGTVIPPCGRCREIMYQLSDRNLNADVIYEGDKVMKLKELLPHPWDTKWKVG